MLTIKNIENLVGHVFSKPHTERDWEVIGIITNSIESVNVYSIELAKFALIYDPMSFAPHKKMIEKTIIVLERDCIDGGYKLYNIKNGLRDHLNMEKHMLNSMNKLILAIDFIM